MFAQLAVTVLLAVAPSFAQDAETEPKPPAFPQVRCLTIYSNLEAAVRQMDEANQAMGEAYASSDMEAFDEALKEWGQASRSYNDQLEEYVRGECEERSGKKPPDAPGQWKRPTD